MYQLEYLPAVKADLEQMMEHGVCQAGGVQQLEKTAEMLIQAAEQLRKFPYLGVSWHPSGLHREEYRVLLVRKYMMFFTIDEEKRIVTVVRVIFGWQLYDRLLKEIAENGR